MATAYCPNCKSRMAPTATTCHTCGYDFPLHEPASEADGWRWEAMASLGCWGLFAWLFVKSDSLNVVGTLILSAMLALGIGFGVSGCRRGGPASRVVAAAGLLLNLACAVVVAWFSLRDGWRAP